MSVDQLKQLLAIRKAYHRMVDSGEITPDVPKLVIPEEVELRLEKLRRLQHEFEDRTQGIMIGNIFVSYAHLEVIRRFKQLSKTLEADSRGLLIDTPVMFAPFDDETLLIGTVEHMAENVIVCRDNLKYDHKCEYHFVAALAN